MSKKKNLLNTTVNFSSGPVVLLRKISESPTSEIFLSSAETIVKFIDLSKLSGRSYFAREIPVYQLMSPHPNILNYLDHIVVNNQAFLHLEYYSKGDYNYIMALNRLSYSDIREVIIDVCMALDDLHAKGILHLDIRPENIILSNEGVSKIGDFGSSLRNETLSEIQEENTFGEFINENTVLPIRPPELKWVNSLGTYSDMWQVGCLLYTMVYYQPPFPYGYNPNVSVEECPKMFKSVLEGLLNPKHELRPTARDVIDMLLPAPILGGVFAERRVTFIEKLIARSTKQLVAKATQDSDENIPVKIIERLVYKALKKPFKIIKFIDSIENRTVDNVAPCIKVIHILHIYMYKVPILLEQHQEKIRNLLQHIIFTWNVKSKEKPLHADFKYISCFIKQYSQLLVKKIVLFEKHGIKCNWANFVMSINSVGDILDYLEFCLYLILGLGLEVVSTLMKIRLEIVKAIANEVSIIILIVTKSFRLLGNTNSGWYVHFKKLYHQAELLIEKKKVLIFLAALPKENISKEYAYHMTGVNPPEREVPVVPNTEKLSTYYNLID